ncbi:MAG: SOS response-associated peptidase family protein [Balneolaceae bacterium]
MKRYVLQTEENELEDFFELSPGSESSFEKNFNIMPGATVPVVFEDKEERKLVEATWGLSSAGAKKALFSVSQEELLKDQELKALAKSSACIIPASGFYKWKETVRDPLPFYLRVLSREILALAGIYFAKKSGKGKIHYSFAVITMPANALVEPLDQTMPCILNEAEFDNWLGGGSIKMLEKGFSGEPLLPDMAVYRVPDLVNDPSNNSRELIQPIPKLRDDD